MRMRAWWRAPGEINYFHSNGPTKMDAIKRPLRIPPDFSKYAEDKGLFELYERMLAELLVEKPQDPLSFLLEHLSQDRPEGEREWQASFKQLKSKMRFCL